MSRPLPPGLGGPILALVAFGIFATHDVLVKVLGATYAPFQIIFFSVLFSFPLATLMLMRDPMSGTLRPVHPWWTALRTGASVITLISAFYAFSTLPLAQVYALIFAAPLLITVLSIPILGERVGPHRWVAVLVGLCGVLIVLRPWNGAALSTGHLTAVLAACGSATAAVVVRKIGKEERGVVLMLYPMVANFTLTGIILPFVYVPMPLAHLGLAGLVAALGFGAGLLIIAAYRRAEAAIVAPMQYSQILWAAFFGILLFDEGADLPTWIGAAIIIASGLYIVVRESAPGRSANTPVSEDGDRMGMAATPRIPAMLRRRAMSIPSYQALANRAPNP
ncbi:drug/metabolite transporter (DMT)-like permease [Palleronia aestuarii]|uniref:Drug/metabolite transporter (DMT)-like permease n=1 Tax=Palleronia aestuarii TaxID=568105 RepID=A0A2W7NK77_9RHOB|nr:DMT family transporter [Palleronia aestuarii]PZX17104.1 drug/metabolite transporter (DMT)-like permease [Palleronia aestuarii]